MHSSIIFHIDVNSAFLSWEAVSRLKSGGDIDLRIIPAAIGGDITKRKGVILAKSIPAKNQGVRTGESIMNALKKCPSLHLAPPNHPLYKTYSDQLINLLKTYSPYIERCSIDECYLRYIGDYHSTNYMDTAKEIAAHVRESLGFTVNIGISSNKLLAKMASDFEKPDKIHTLWPEEIQKKMWPLPVDELYMVGRASANKLKNLGIFTIGELAQSNLQLLTYHLKRHGRLIWEYANGFDDASVSSKAPDLKGIGNSTTLAQDAIDLEAANHVLLSLAETVGNRLRADKSLASMISVELKTNTFVHRSHQCTLTTPTDNTAQIYETACNLLKELWKGEPIRLLGIRTGKLVSVHDAYQLSIFDLNKDPKQKKVDSAIDKIREKFGHHAIKRASLIHEFEDD